MTPEKELESLIVTKLLTVVPSGVQVVRKQQITTAADLPRVVVSCDVGTENQALAQVGMFSINTDVEIRFDAITGTDPATDMRSTIAAVDSVLLNWQDLYDNSAICYGGTFGAGSTTNEEDALVRTISGVLWARKRVVVPGTPNGNILVSGAGTTAANGTYEPDGMNEGRPEYTKGNYRIFWNTFEWKIGDDSLFYYASSVPASPATPDLVTEWAAGDGEFPLPTVTAVISPSTTI
jgi:hypothetical protein